MNNVAQIDKTVTPIIQGDLDIKIRTGCGTFVGARALRGFADLAGVEVGGHRGWRGGGRGEREEVWVSELELGFMA